VEELIRFLESLRTQASPPDELIVVDGSETPDEPRLKPVLDSLPWRVVYVRTERQGITVQRNIGLGARLPSAELIGFFDDDVVLEADYLRMIVDAFQQDKAKRIGGMNGFPLVDGNRRNSRNPVYELIDVPDLYGCNMVYRAEAIGNLRFDENLALYGWMEDWDFSKRVARNRRLVCCNQAYFYHLQSPKARVNGRKFGYMQIANRNYLYKKHSVFDRREYVFYAGVLLKNLARSYRKTYRERCLGNLRALREIFHEGG